MASAILVDVPVEAGWHLLDLLDAADFSFQITAAFWKYEEEAQEWRLYLASPRVGTDGPLALYRQMQPLLDALPASERAIWHVYNTPLVTPDALVVRELKRRRGSVSGRRDAPVWPRSFAGDEPFIYRL